MIVASPFDVAALSGVVSMALRHAEEIRALWAPVAHLCRPDALAQMFVRGTAPDLLSDQVRWDTRTDADAWRAAVAEVQAVLSRLEFVGAEDAHAIRVSDIGRRPVGWQDGAMGQDAEVVWLWDLHLQVLRYATYAALGNERARELFARHAPEYVRAVDAVLSKGIRPCDSHDEAAAELRRVG